MSQRTGVLASPHYLATEVGIDVLRKGGNAFDAAVAVALALGVVQPYHSGIGGGCSITYLTADGNSGSIQSRGSAPRRLERSLFLEPDGTPNYKLSRVGALAIIVPGLIAGLHIMHRTHGRLPWPQLCLAPRSLAQEGFLADVMLARYSSQPETVEKLALVAAEKPLGKPIREGQRLVQPEMAATLSAIAEDPDVLYKGEIGRNIARYVQELGGVLTVADLESYQPKHQPLLAGEYRGWRILVPGLPTVGALQLVLALQVLDHFSLSDLGFGSAEHLHLVAEAVKLSYMARAGLNGELEAMALTDRGWAKKMAAMIRRDRAIRFGPLPVPSDEGNCTTFSASAQDYLDHDPLPVPSDEGNCTSHFSLADGEGNVVAQTQTIGRRYGSGVIEPDSGIVLNDLVGDFSLRAGAMTFQGIRYGRYNLLEPGAEPASSQSPVIALNPRTGEILAAGAAGGPKIVSATVQALVNCIDFDLDAWASASAPRLYCQGPVLKLEPGVGFGTAAQLEALGHQVKKMPAIAQMQIIRWDGRTWEGVADPRGVGSASVLLKSA